MRRFVILAGMLAGLALAGAAEAQPRLEDPEARLVEELVVQARTPGPAWWKVSDADSTVWILGIADADLPAGVAWDRRWAERRLQGANSLIVGTRVSLRAKVSDVPGLLKIRGRLRAKAPVETTLPEGLRARFVAVRERIGRPAGRYAGWQPMMAGQMLLADVRQARGKSPVVDPILKAAKRQKVKIVDPARYDAMPFLRAATDSLTPAIQTQCLDLALADAEAPAGQARSAAEGWARGDVPAALREPRAFEKCLLLLGGGPDLWRRMVKDNADAIQAALDRPGHAVAIISLRPLLAEGGVAQTLEARGLDVEAGG